MYDAIQEMTPTNTIIVFKQPATGTSQMLQVLGGLH